MLMIITMIFFQIRFQIITKIQQPLQKGHLFKQWITNFQDLIAIIIIVVIIIIINTIAIILVHLLIQIMVMQLNVLLMLNQYQVPNILEIATCQR